MQNLNIKTGVKEYQVTEGGALLRFNPADQNIYSRFVAAAEKMEKIEAEARAEAEAITNRENAAVVALRILSDADRKMKKVLNEVFGGSNDFDEILCGTSLLAVNDEGKRVMEVLLEALQPILEDGIRAYAQEVVEDAKQNREQRRAMGQ